ncbi:hypothetical protein [Paenibacillus spiritus]|uniref:hypothetical protein n=1 Tax=Paenibacillus spiritus TaxID=2496557 RepID=UPI00295EA2BF|nr:hypothetical protein [Paenibacillus spiritus]
MNEMLYHAYLPEGHEHYVSREVITSEGINHRTKSNNRFGLISDKQSVLIWLIGLQGHFSFLNLQIKS